MKRNTVFYKFRWGSYHTPHEWHYIESSEKDINFLKEIFKENLSSCDDDGKGLEYKKVSIKNIPSDVFINKAKQCEQLAKSLNQSARYWRNLVSKCGKSKTSKIIK